MSLINNNPMILENSSVTNKNIKPKYLQISKYNKPLIRINLLEIIINSPTYEQYKLNQLQKGYVKKVKPYITKWI